MKEFLELVKTYKEFIALVAGLVGFSVFVMKHFASQEEMEKQLSSMDQNLKKLVSASSCHLAARIGVASATANIINLERESLDLITQIGDYKDRIADAKLAPDRRVFLQDLIDRLEQNKARNIKSQDAQRALKQAMQMVIDAPECKSDFAQVK